MYMYIIQCLTCGFSSTKIENQKIEFVFGNELCLRGYLPKMELSLGFRLRPLRIRCFNPLDDQLVLTLRSRLEMMRLWALHIGQDSFPFHK